jgi:hypothetical protein
MVRVNVQLHPLLVVNELVGVVTLPIFFGTLRNLLMKYTTFDIVDMLYPYNAIFGRGQLNIFEAALSIPLP